MIACLVGAGWRAGRLEGLGVGTGALAGVVAVLALALSAVGIAGAAKSAEVRRGHRNKPDGENYRNQIGQTAKGAKAVSRKM